MSVEARIGMLEGINVPAVWYTCEVKKEIRYIECARLENSYWHEVDDRVQIFERDLLC